MHNLWVLYVARAWMVYGIRISVNDRAHTATAADRQKETLAAIGGGVSYARLACGNNGQPSLMNTDFILTENAVQIAAA